MSTPFNLSYEQKEHLANLLLSNQYKKIIDELFSYVRNDWMNLSSEEIRNLYNAFAEGFFSTAIIYDHIFRTRAKKISLRSKGGKIKNV